MKQIRMRLSLTWFNGLNEKREQWFEERVERQLEQQLKDRELI